MIQQLSQASLLINRITLLSIKLLLSMISKTLVLPSRICLSFPQTKEDQLENIVEKWICFFKYANETSEEDFKKIIVSNIIIGNAYSELNQFSWTKDERFAYEQAKKHTDDHLSTLSQKLNEGIKIGQVKGIEIGEERGEMKAKIAVAKEMLADTNDINTFAQFITLSIDGIKKWINTINCALKKCRNFTACFFS
jgi:predicted transposase/invertase (TIGR01784 family)